MTYRPHPQQDAIRALHDDHGALTPQLLVDTARDPASGLHPLFDWDHDPAQLLTRARNLIRAQRTVITVRTGQHVVAEYVTVHSKEDGLHYIATTRLREHVEQGVSS